MNKTIDISENYSFKKFDKPVVVSSNQSRIGYVLDKNNHKPILFLY